MIENGQPGGFLLRYDGLTIPFRIDGPAEWKRCRTVFDDGNPPALCDESSPAPGFGTKGCGDGSREGAGGMVARLLARTFAGEEVRAVEGRGRQNRRLTNGTRPAKVPATTSATAM
jgi:hypothetical protein